MAPKRPTRSTRAKPGTSSNRGPVSTNASTQPASSQPSHDQLVKMVQELTEKLAQQQQSKVTPGLLRKPTTFNGTLDDIATGEIETFLNVVKDFVVGSGTDITEEKGEKTLMASTVSWLGTDPRRDYHTHTGAHGAFPDYKSLKEWLLQRYSPADPLHTYFDVFNSCFQGSDESFEAFHSRFTKAHSLLKDPEPAPKLTQIFVSRLVRGIRGEVRKDISEYENLTTHDILAKLKRQFPSGKPPSFRPASSMPLTMRIDDGKGNSGHSNKRHRPNHDSYNDKEKQHKRGKHSGNPSTSKSIPPLTDGEKKFLDQNVKKGGGRYIYDHIQDHPEWRTIADAVKVCYRCGALGHNRDSCTVQPSTRANGGKLNFIQSISSLFEPGALDHLNSKQ
jgi:hypothetical protein